MELITTVEEAVRSIDSFVGLPEDFEFVLADKLTLHGEEIPYDAAFAMITYRVFDRGWQQLDVTSVAGGRIYRFKQLQ